MKALTVKQPYAHLIALDVKLVEVRSWSTKYRGELLITASKTPKYTLHGVELPVGTTVCVVNLLDVRPMVKRDANLAWCDYQRGAFAWHIDLLYLTKPTPVVGKVGLWTPDSKIIRKA